MTLRTSLIITGDSKGAQGALKDLAGGMGQAEAAAEGLATAERQTEAATEALGAELHQARAAANGLESELTQARGATAALGGGVVALGNSYSGAIAASRGHTRSMGEQALGARMLGQQLQDVGIMAAMGVTSAADVLRILAMQAGQTALALEQMGVKGAAGRVVQFLGSPWGSAIMAAGMVLSPFIARLFDADEAQSRVELGAYALSDAQSVLSGIFDLNTGQIKANTEALILNARAKALNLRADAGDMMRSSNEVFASAGQLGAGGALGAFFSRGTELPWDRVQMLQQRASEVAAYLAAIRDARTDEERTDASDRALKFSEDFEFSGLSVTRQEFQQAIVDRAAAQANTAIADLIDKSLDDRELAAGLRRMGGRTRRPASTEARDEFGRDAADKIDAVVDRFSEVPGELRQANAAIRQMDDLIEDLGRKRPPNFQALIASAEEAKDVVRDGLIASIVEPFDMTPPAVKRAADAIGLLDAAAAQFRRDNESGLISPEQFRELSGAIAEARIAVDEGLNRPFNEFLLSQDEALRMQRLILAGREDEAEALGIILRLEQQIGPLSKERKDAILASVQALTAEERALDRLYAKQQIYLNAIGDVRSTLTQTIYEGFDGLDDLPNRLLETFRRFTAELLARKLFAPAFEAMEDQVTGTRIVEDAAARFRDATAEAGGALDGLTASAREAAAAVRHGAISGDVGAAADSVAAGAVQGLLGGAAGAAPSSDIVVQADVISDLDNPREFFSELFSKLGKEVGIDERTAEWIGKAIGVSLEGALFGQLGSSALAMLGVQHSATGASIGGMLGTAGGKEFLSGILGSFAGPVGGILGGIAGGLFGSLFSSPKYGTASLTGGGDPGLSGNSGGLRQAAGTLAGQVQSGLADIADRLGGELGRYSVSIGTWDGKYRVNSNATNRALHYNNFNESTLKNFGDDQAGAIAYAIADAIKDGAVTGLSAAVQQALRSSSDVEAALDEALKVGDVELLLGGVQAELERAFTTFEAEAKERVRIARQYGFDVAEIERINAKERLDLSKQLLEQQVGSLQQLVDDMTHGSMFEGSAVDRRSALLEEIEKAKADMDAGVEGAANVLANLYQQLNEVSKEVYGTTGGFATDRAAILDEARAAIAKANADIAAASGSNSDPALAQTNAALDENNDQNARMLAALLENNELLRNLPTWKMPLGDLDTVARRART